MKTLWIKPTVYRLFMSLILCWLLNYFTYAQESKTGCTLYYQPIIEIQNVGELDYTGTQVYFVIDREKFMPLNQSMTVKSGESYLFHLPPLMTKTGMHILEIYVSAEGLQPGNHHLAAQFRDADLVTELDNVVPLEVSAQGEPVLQNTLSNADSTDTSLQRCACLSNADGNKPLTSLWYSYTINAQGDAMIFTTVDNGQDWKRAAKEVYGDNVNCSQYQSEMKVAGSEKKAKVNFVPESELIQANGQLPEEPDELLVGVDAFVLYPNPFRGKTTISYRLEEDGPVKIEIFSYGGLKLRTLLNEGIQLAGRHALQFSPANWPSGLYFCRIETATELKTIKFIINQ